MAVTHKLIETVTVGSGGAASIEFTSIPQTYTDLLIVLSVQNTASAVDIFGKFNTLSTGFTNRHLYGNGFSAISGNNSIGYFGAASPSSSNTFGNTAIYIPNYAGSTNKSFSSDSVTENDATSAYGFFVAGLWSNTSAITSIEFYPNAYLWSEYSSASLYGINNS
jgi:hypothetical protein